MSSKDIQLDRIDVLEMENISIKIGIAKTELHRLISKKIAIGEAIQEKYKIDDLQRYIFDPETGKGKRIEPVENKEAENA